jgi:hypothetical protein
MKRACLPGRDDIEHILPHQRTVSVPTTSVLARQRCWASCGHHAKRCLRAQAGVSPA